MKKLISALLSATLLAGVAAMPAAAEETYSLGDVTMDGVVDVADAIDLLKYYTVAVVLNNEGDLTEDQLALADVNYHLGSVGDGAIDIGDCCTILSYYVYTILVEDPVAPETFFADFGTYWGSLDENAVEDANNEAVKEGQEYIGGGSHEVQ